MITRGIDLSVGGVIDVSNSLAATHMQDSLVSMVGWSLAILALGAAFGALNGVLVAYGRLQPILVTLATLAILQGLAIWILPEPGGSIPPRTRTRSRAPRDRGACSSSHSSQSPGSDYDERRRAFGSSRSETTNRPRAHTGFRCAASRSIAFSLSGLLAAASGLFLSASTTGGDAAAGDVYILTSIAAVVLGGISFYGGRGSALGSIAGAFVLTILTNVLFFAGIDPLYQSFFQGLFLVLAVFLGVIFGRLLKAST